jgi:hypothetical protein
VPILGTKELLGIWRGSFMSLMVAVAGSSVKSTPAWMLPSKVLAKFEYAFHLMLEGIFNPDLEENEEV